MSMIVMPDVANLNRTSRTTEVMDKLFAANPAVADRAVVNGYSLIDGQYKTTRRPCSCR